MNEHRFSEVSFEDIERLVAYYVEWAGSLVVANSDSMHIEPKLMVPPWDWLRERYPSDEMASRPENYKVRTSRVAERTLQLAMQDVFMPDFVNAACLFFIVTDCHMIMEGEEFRQATADRQLELKQFEAIARVMFSMSEDQMIKAYVQSKYNRNVRENSKDWHTAWKDIDARFNRAFQVWCQSRD